MNEDKELKLEKLKELQQDLLKQMESLIRKSDELQARANVLAEELRKLDQESAG